MPLTRLQDEEASSDGKTSVLTKAQYAAASELIGRSFAGTPECDPEWTMHWMIGPHLPRESVELRSSLCEFYVSFNVHKQTSSGGAVLAAKDADGNLAAVCVCRKLSSGKESSLWSGWLVCKHIVTCVMQGKFPPFYASKEYAPLRKSAEQSINRRAKCVHKVMKQLHEQQARPHWHVALLTVDPTAQGKGYGDQLIRAVSRMAFADGVHCYLEASGTRNQAIYEHLGYTSVDQKRLGVKETVDLQWADQEHVCAMVRDVDVK